METEDKSMIWRPRGRSHSTLKAEYQKCIKNFQYKPGDLSSMRSIVKEILKKCEEDVCELTADENSFYFLYKDKKGQDTKITNFDVMLISVIHEHSLDKDQYFYNLLVKVPKIDQDISWKQVKVETSKFGLIQWIEELGPTYIYCSALLPMLKKTFQLLASYVSVEHEYTYQGWSESGSEKPSYIFPIDSTPDNLQSETDCYIHAVKMLDTAAHALTIPLLATALLSLVHSQMIKTGLFFKGVVCIVAPTQSYKTTLASLFFDFENGLKSNTNFEATRAAIIRTIGNRRDSTTIVDDYKPGSTKAERSEMIKKISTIIRMCSDDSGGIQRASSKNETISNIAQGLVVVTAEQIQLSVQSSLARLLIVELDRKSVDIGNLNYYQSYHKTYYDFIHHYIHYITNMDVTCFCEELAQRFVNERNTLRKKIDKRIPVDNRASDMCTWLWLAFEEFLNRTSQIKALRENEVNAYREESKKIFADIIELQGTRVAELDPVQQFFRGLQVLYETQCVEIKELQLRNTCYSAESSEKVIGYSKANRIYLKNGAAIQAVASYYRRLGTEFLINDSLLRKELANRGYIIPKSEKTHIHRLNVNRKNYQCIVFESKKFYYLLKGDCENECRSKEEISSNRELREISDMLF